MPFINVLLFFIKIVKREVQQIRPPLGLNSSGLHNELVQSQYQVVLLAYNFT